LADRVGAGQRRIVGLGLEWAVRVLEGTDMRDKGINHDTGFMDTVMRNAGVSTREPFDRRCGRSGGLALPVHL
jgi:hypothetical protein